MLKNGRETACKTTLVKPCKTTLVKPCKTTSSKTGAAFVDKKQA